MPASDTGCRTDGHAGIDSNRDRDGLPGGADANRNARSNRYAFARNANAHASANYRTRRNGERQAERSAG